MMDRLSIILKVLNTQPYNTSWILKHRGVFGEDFGTILDSEIRDIYLQSALKQKPSLLRIAIGGPTYIMNDYVPLDWNHSYEITVSKIERQTMVFSTNQCLIWGYSICQKGKYFCEIDGKIEFINNEVTFNEAKKDCRMSNGHLSKKLVFYQIRFLFASKHYIQKEWYNSFLIKPCRHLKISYPISIMNVYFGRIYFEVRVDTQFFQLLKLYFQSMKPISKELNQEILWNFVIKPPISIDCFFPMSLFQERLLKLFFNSLAVACWINHIITLNYNFFKESLLENALPENSRAICVCKVFS